MNEAQKNFLMRKLAKLQITVEEKEQEKKNLNAGYTETIKTFKKRISAFSKAVETGLDEYVEDTMHESEYSEYLGIS